jgi:hypothetical protein
VLTNGLSQFKKSLAVSVVGFPLPQSPFTSSPDTGWRVEIGLTYLQVDYVFTLTLKRLGTLEHIHDYKWSYFFGTFGDHGQMLKMN